jgi:hypothetical protein
MSSNLQKITSSDMIDSSVSFFKRKEGRAGIVGIGVTGVLLLAGAQAAGIPQLFAEGAWFTFRGLITAACSLGVVFVLTDKRFHEVFKIGCWMIYDRFIDRLDPARIAEYAMQQQSEILETLTEKQSIVTGFVERLTGSINKNEREIEKCRAKLREMLRPGVDYSSGSLAQLLKPEYADDEDTASVVADKESLLVEANNNYASTLEVFSKMDAVISKNVKLAKSMYTKMENRLNIIIDTRKTMTGARGAVEGIRSILFHGEYKRLANDAEQKMVLQISADMGYFKNFVAETAPLTREMDIEKKINVQKALDRLNSVKQDDRILKEYTQSSGEFATVSRGTAGYANEGGHGKASLFDSI